MGHGKPFSWMAAILMMQRSAQTSQAVPLDITGSSTFGRWPKISSARTLNMFTADNFSINFAGYQYRITLNENGRGLYSSNKGGYMFAVSARYVYEITSTLESILIGSLQTDASDVSIDEDLSSNIAFCDGSNIYIYNYVSKKFYIAGQGSNIGTATQSTFSVTGTNTAFNSNMVGGTIYFSNGTSATITAVTDSTHLTVNVSQTISPSSAYFISYPMDCVPNYVKFHDGRFEFTSSLSGDNKIGQWRLSSIDATTGMVFFPNDAQHQGAFQTKPDLPVAITRLPGRQSQIIVMGSEVAQIWTDLGLALFPYQLNTTFNLDFGCVNPATISEINNTVVWLASNERAGPFIAYTTGQDIQKISTDGIDSFFEKITDPTSSYGFTFVQSGHMFYVLTFYNPNDNATLAYDFNTGKFYDLSDENGDFFIAKKVVRFNGKYYFISINDGNIYEFSSYFTTYNYKPKGTDGIKQIPRGRTCTTYRTPDSVTKRFNDLYFILEQGVDSGYDGTGNKVSGLSISSGGTGYTTASVLIEGDGHGASATCTITNGVITSVSLSDGGVGYSWAVATIIGDGTGAQLNTSIGISDYIPRVDLSVSYDGGYTWSNYAEMDMQVLGNYKNRFYFNGLGSGNEITVKFLYHCKNRFVCSDGEMNVY